MGNSQSIIKNFDGVKLARSSLIHRMRREIGTEKFEHSSKARLQQVRQQKQQKQEKAKAKVTPAAEDEDPLPFRFLQLPQELRDEIYQYHIQDCDRFYIMEKKHFTFNTRLHLVCKEIHEQLVYLEAKFAGTAIVVCMVLDFDFRPVIAELDMLLNSNHSTNIFGGAEHSESPTLILQLAISDPWNVLDYVCTDTLMLWRTWIDANSKQGLGINVEYMMWSMEKRVQSDESYQAVAAGESLHSIRDSVSTTSTFCTWDDIKADFVLEKFFDWGIPERLFKQPLEITEREEEPYYCCIDEFGLLCLSVKDRPSYVG